MLSVTGLCKSFGAIDVTNELTFSIPKGQRHIVLGPNGAGKTTLFNLLVGELRPSRGQIHFDETDITARTVEQRAQMGIARSYQKNNLFEGLTVRENLSIAVTMQQRKIWSIWRDAFKHSSVKHQVEEIAELTKLMDALAVNVEQLPYGKRRQLEIAIALAAKPKLLLMDEPTSGLGPELIDGFYELCLSLPTEMTTIIIEHDFDLAFRLADQISVLDQGRLVFQGTAAETKASTIVNDIYLGTDFDDD